MSVTGSGGNCGPAPCGVADDGDFHSIAILIQAWRFVRLLFRSVGLVLTWNDFAFHWIPAFAGMTALSCAAFGPNHLNRRGR